MRIIDVKVTEQNSIHTYFRITFEENATFENAVGIRYYNNDGDQWVLDATYWEFGNYTEEAWIKNTILNGSGYAAFYLTNNRNYLYDKYNRFTYFVNANANPGTMTELDLVREADRVEFGLTAEFPTLEEYSVERGPSNSNSHYVSVKFGDTSHNVAFNQDYNHIHSSMLLTNSANPSDKIKIEIPRTVGEIMPHEIDRDLFCYTPLQDFTFAVPSGKKYNLCILIENGENADKIWKSEEKLIDCSYDNIAPQIVMPKAQSAGTSVVLKTGNIDTRKLVTEDNFLLYNGKPYLYYSYTDSSLMEQYFDISDSKRMQSFEPDAESISFPLYVEKANYLNVKLYDAYGNTCYRSLKITNSWVGTYDYWQGDPYINSMQKNADGKLEMNVYYGWDVYEDGGLETNFEKFNKGQSAWETYAKYNTTTEFDDTDFGLNITNNSIVNSYMRIQTRWHNTNKITTPPVYYYPPYVNGNITCNLKSLIDINGVMTLTCDQPTLIHTLFSGTNYGTDISAWELLAAEVNAKVVSSTINYNPDSISINKGEYYIVVVYFADGTRLTSKVYQK